MEAAFFRGHDFVTTASGKSNPIVCKIAFVGAGYMATEHMKAFSDVPGVELSAIFSRTVGRAESLAKEYGVRAVCCSVEELYDKSRANLVVVAVPELSVHGVAEACFGFPWACLIEKPAGYNVDDAEAIAASARALGSRAFVALNRRHYSSTQTVLRDLSSNPSQRFIHVQDQEDVVAALRAGQPKLVVDNWMYANSIHVIDYLLLLGRGKVTTVDSLLRWTPRAPSFVAAKILFDSGDIGLYEAVWNGPGPWAVSVTTKTKRWEMRPLEQAAFQLYGRRNLEPVESGEWDKQFKPGLRRQADLAVRAALGDPVPELPTLDDALVSMRLTQVIYDAGDR